MKRNGLRGLTVLLGAGTTMFQGCPVNSLLGGVFDSCFGPDTISADEFDDLNVLEQLLWEENDCGRYEERTL